MPSRYLLGGALNAGAHNLAMLICGRAAQGFAVGFANQSVPLFLSEMVRGAGGLCGLTQGIGCRATRRCHTWRRATSLPGTTSCTVRAVELRWFRSPFALKQAPFQARGALNILFQLATTTGVLAAQVRAGPGLRAEDWRWGL